MEDDKAATKRECDDDQCLQVIITPKKDYLTLGDRNYWVTLPGPSPVPESRIKRLTRIAERCAYDLYNSCYAPNKICHALEHEHRAI